MIIVKAVVIFLISFAVGYASSFSTATSEQKVAAVGEMIETELQINLENVLPSESEDEAPDAEKLEVIDEVTNHINDEKTQYDIKLLETGYFHGAEVDAKSGEEWLGLFQEDNKYVLRVTTLKVTRYLDEVIGRDDGKRVVVEINRRPEFLLKRSGMKAGEIMTIFPGKISDAEGDEFETFLDRGFSRAFELGDRKYKLSVIDGLNTKNEPVLALLLTGDGKRQILHTNRGSSDEGVGRLYWVGDLDRDGKPDFYLSPYVHYNVSNYVLFLSSKAEPDKLVKKVAYLWTTGC